MKYFVAFLISGVSFSLSAQTTTENQTALSFLSYVSSQVVGRPLTANEAQQVKSNGTNSFNAILNQWTDESSFPKSMQIFVDNLIKTSGEAEGVDFNTPGYLARDLAAKKRPYAELITANYCINKSGASGSCDSQAPFAAGILTTKAFLATYKGAYNISRAGKFVTKFLCASYPLPANEEPRLTESELISQFATTQGAITFGNGNNCYSCHSQFGLHTQFFVKFDNNGTYKASATGLQNPSPAVTDGFSTDGLLTSHLKDPNNAKSEKSRILGQTAMNLAEAATVVTKSPRFLPCAVQNLTKYLLRLSDEQINTINPELYKQIAAQAQAMNPQPSFSDLVKAILSNNHIYNSFKKSGAQP